MKKIELGQTIGIVANLGVIAGIVFLAIEIEQNTAMIEAEMRQSRAEIALGMTQALFNSDYLPEIFVTAREGEQLTAVQAERLKHWFRGFNRNLENQLHQYREGLLTEEIPRSVRLAIQDSFVGIPATKEMWASTKLQFSDDYIKLVDEVLAENQKAAVPE